MSDITEPSPQDIKVPSDCLAILAEISQEPSPQDIKVPSDCPAILAEISQERSAKRLLKVCQFAKEEFQEQENVTEAKQSQCEGAQTELKNLDLGRTLSQTDLLNFPPSEHEISDQKDKGSNITITLPLKRRYQSFNSEKEILDSDSSEEAIEVKDDGRTVLGHASGSKEKKQVTEYQQGSQSSSTRTIGGLGQEEPIFNKNDSCFDVRNIEGYFPPISEAGNVDITEQQSGSSLQSLNPTTQEPKIRDTVIQKQNTITPPAEVSQQSKQSLQYWVKKFSSILIEHLNKFGLCVIDDFIGAARGTRILNEVLQMQETTPFMDGRLSQDLSNPSVRSDKISWVDGVNPPCPAIRSLLNLFDAIVLTANKTPENGELGKYRINGRTRAMVACYPGRGSHYVRHVDNPNMDGRCITAIYYLNKNWLKEYGGTLMIYPSSPVGAVASVDPVFDRVIFFWSDRRNPHEVMPAYRPRYAITAWYFDSEEKNLYTIRQEISKQK